MPHRLKVEIHGQTVILEPPQRLFLLSVRTLQGTEIACLMHTSGTTVRGGTIIGVRVGSSTAPTPDAPSSEGPGLPESFLQRLPIVTELDFKRVRPEYTLTIEGGGGADVFNPGACYEISVVGDVSWRGDVVAEP